MVGKSVAFLLGLVAVSVAAQTPALVRFAFVDVDSSPFQVGKGEAIANPPGLAVELVRQGVRDAGMSLQLQRLPQLRMLKELEEGTVDGAFVFSFTPERAQLYAYPMLGDQPDSSLRVTTISYRLYRRKGSRAGWDGQQFSNIDEPIGVNTGWVMAKSLRDKGLPVDDGGKGYPENFAKLRSGRISAYAGLEPSADSFLKANQLTAVVEKVGPPLQSKDYFLLFSKRYLAKHPDAVRRIWQAVARAREQNEAALYRKYQDVAPQ